MSEISQPPYCVQQTKKLRSACDACHQRKVRCSGGLPCSRCVSKGLPCWYRFQNRAGKPKGSKNKKTLERQRQMNETWMAQISSPRTLDNTNSVLDSEQPDFSPSYSTILDNTDWFQDPAFYSGPSSAVYAADQIVFKDVMYEGQNHSVVSNDFSEPWIIDPDLCINHSSDDNMVECNEFISRLRLGNVDGASGDENDPLFALGAEMNHLTSTPISCKCVQNQAANFAFLDHIKPGNVTGLDRI